MAVHYTSCNLCEATCGVAIEVEGANGQQRVVSVRGDEADEFSRGYICPKATALADIHHDPDRLKVPLQRTATGWRELSWDDAFDEVARRIEDVQDRHGNNAVAYYQGNPTVHSLGAMTFGQIFFRRVKTRNRYSATSADQLPHMLAGLLMFGHQLALPVPDLDRTDYLVILGGNPLVSNGSLMTAPDFKRRMRDIQARGGVVIVVDPRRTETAELADRHLFLRPGTDALLLLGVIHTLFGEGLVALGALADRVAGLDELRAAADGFAPEQVAGATGVAADDIRTLARELAGAPRAACYGRVGLCTQEYGGLAAWLVNAVNVLTGNLDRPGGAMFPTPAFDLVAMANRLGQRGSYARYRSRVSGLPEFGGELPVAALAEEIETPGDGQIKALITAAGNPVLSIANGSRLDRALPKLDFMVSIDIYKNETTRHADIILPPTFLLERDHYDVAFGIVSVRNVAKYSPAVFTRAPQQRHDWEIFAELATRVGLRGSPVRKLAARAARAALLRVGPRGMVDLAVRTGPHKLSPRALHGAPHGLDLGPLQPRLDTLLGGRRIQLAPREYLADLDRLRAREQPAGLHLIGRRQLRSNNSWMHNSHRLVKGPVRCTLLVHPDDAARLGIADGAQVRVRSRVGEVRVPAAVTDEVMPGVVSLPHGWGHDRDGTQLSVARAHAGASVNDLTDDARFDRLSGNACFNGVPVTVEPA